MAVLTYKCPHCDGGLIFDPQQQTYACEYCLSTFTQEELEALHPASEKERAATSGEAPPAAGAGEAAVYTCPSCGAQIAADPTTAATFCYYCHNPVVLSGKLAGEQMPALVVPFQLSKEQAKERFTAWIGKKRFVPAGFYAPKQIDKLSGVYFPYWTYAGTLEGELTGTARDIRSWRSGNQEYTETKTYSIRRRGAVWLKDIARNALQRSQGKMMEGILPFALEQAQPFHTGFLSGFQAEVKDMERDAFASGVKQESEGYVRRLLADTIVGHTSFHEDSFLANETEGAWQYVLLPVWVLTYRAHGEMYYFAMNGQTGEVCGKLPLNKTKLGLVCAGLFAAVTALVTLIGALII